MVKYAVTCTIVPAPKNNQTRAQNKNNKKSFTKPDIKLLMHDKVITILSFFSIITFSRVSIGNFLFIVNISETDIKTGTRASDFLHYQVLFTKYKNDVFYLSPNVEMCNHFVSKEAFLPSFLLKASYE